MQSISMNDLFHHSVHLSLGHTLRIAPICFFQHVLFLIFEQ